MKKRDSFWLIVLTQDQNAPFGDGLLAAES
jgi:hypothetical protein